MIKNVIAGALLAVSLLAADETTLESPALKEEGVIALTHPSASETAIEQAGSVTVIGATNILWNFSGTNKLESTISTNVDIYWAPFITNAQKRTVEFLGSYRTNRVVTLRYNGGAPAPITMEVIGMEKKPSQARTLPATPVRRQ